MSKEIYQESPCTGHGAHTGDGDQGKRSIYQLTYSANYNLDNNYVIWYFIKRFCIIKEIWGEWLWLEKYCH